MPNKKKPAKRAPAPAKVGKAGTSKAAAQARRVALAHAYIVNGRNWTRAAVTAGYKPGRAAEKAGERASKDVVVQKIIREATEKAAKISGLTVELTLREVARAAYFDPRRLYDEEGKLKAVHELDDDVAAVLAGIEVTEEFEGRGAEKKAVGVTKKLKFVDKNGALEKAMRHLGLYEEDNRQRPPPLELPPGVKSVRLDFSKVRARAKEAARRH